MVRHIVLWKFKDEFTEAEKMSNAIRIKESLEALVDMIPGVVSIKVTPELLASTSDSVDLVLDSLYESEEALNNYQGHPEHLKAAGFVRSVIKDRVCIDYKEV